MNPDRPSWVAGVPDYLQVRNLPPSLYGRYLDLWCSWGGPKKAFACARLGRALAEAVAAQIDPPQAMRLIRLCGNHKEVYRWWRRSTDPDVRDYAKRRYMELRKR